MKNRKKEKLTVETIVSDGHIYWIDKDGKNHITFFNNAIGQKLKETWKELHKPIKQKVAVK